MPATVAMWIGSASSRAALAMATTNDREASPERDVAETDLVFAENRVAVAIGLQALQRQSDRSAHRYKGSLRTTPHRFVALAFPLCLQPS